MTDQATTRRWILQRLGAGLAGAAGAAVWPGIARSADTSHPPHWSYEGAEGPARWGHLAPGYQACGSGRRQSPIDLATAHLGGSDDLVFDWHPFAAKVSNNGHTIQVDPEADAAGSGLTLGGRRFNFLQFHFHHPSEHALAGKRWPLEVHLVHKAASGDGLAVLGIMLRPGRANDLLGRIVAHMPKERGKVPLSGPIDLAAWLPTAAVTYRYPGSLTTPPCSEIVDWIVFRDPIEAGIGQIKSFARLFPMNARPLQPLADRNVTLDFF